ncbi:hypothetical protein [Lentzea sp. NPDC092896]|uniref:hypothetical protein n=1 Tax=Lentzea sp. NPDC092896 TaxID=3364127 RepID=UPI0038111C00
MTTPTGESTVVPFAGLPVIQPPPPEPLAQRVESMLGTLARDARDSLIDHHYRNAGEDHAELLTQRLVDARLAPSSLRPLDVSGALDAYERAMRQGPTPGFEEGLDQQHYVAGLCEHLAVQATRYDEAVAIARTNGHSDLRALDMEGSISTATLPLQDVSALAEDMREVARGLAATEGLVVPTLRAHDESAAERQRTQEAADRLAVLIDEFAVRTALPQFDHSQMDGRGISDTSRAAARIARIQAETPSAIALLDSGRAHVLKDLVPDASWHDQQRSSGDGPTYPPSPLHRAAERFLNRLIHPTAPRGKLPEAEKNARNEISRRIAKLHAQDPEVVRTLPPVHAGLVRAVVAAVSQAPPPAAQPGRAKLTLVGPRVDADPSISPSSSRPRG